MPVISKEHDAYARQDIQRVRQAWDNEGGIAYTSGQLQNGDHVEVYGLYDGLRILYINMGRGPGNDGRVHSFTIFRSDDDEKLELLGLVGQATSKGG